MSVLFLTWPHENCPHYMAKIRVSLMMDEPFLRFKALLFFKFGRTTRVSISLTDQARNYTVSVLNRLPSLAIVFNRIRLILLCVCRACWSALPREVDAGQPQKTSLSLYICRSHGTCHPIELDTFTTAKWERERHDSNWNRKQSLKCTLNESIIRM